MDETNVVIAGGFDDLRSDQVRLLEEASKLGPLHVQLWSDDVFRRLKGRNPKFPEAERQYLVGAIRYVDRVTLCRDVDEASDDEAKRAFCRAGQYRVLRQQDLLSLPNWTDELPAASPRPRVIVTGCFDWFHSGHVRFFEEVSELGDLYAIVGHDANIRLLKGKGHPLFPEQQRRYLVQSVRWVTQALISTGQGWLDAEPEILRIKPQIYAVNEDGDRPEKRQYCQAHGIEYRVLKRLPKEGLPRRQSTNLRGF